MIYSYDKNRLVFDKIKIKTILLKYTLPWTIPLILTSMLIGYSLSSVGNHPNEIEKLVYHDRLVLLSETKINDTTLSNYLKKYRLKFPSIVMAQAIHESNRYTSDIFFDNYNLFGLRVPGSRPTTALGSRKGYAYYDSWEMSVLDYALYQAAFLRTIKTENQYLEYLNRNYASDPQYVKNIKRYLKETKPYFITQKK